MKEVDTQSGLNVYISICIAIFDSVGSRPCNLVDKINF